MNHSYQDYLKRDAQFSDCLLNEGVSDLHPLSSGVLQSILELHSRAT